MRSQRTSLDSVTECTHIFLLICFILKPAFGCTSTTNQYKRPGEDVTIQFQARTVNSEDSSLIVLNRILNNADSPLLSALYTNGVKTHITACNNCTFTGNATTGDLSIRLDNLQPSDAGTYKHSVAEASKEVKGCVFVYILGQPTKPSITLDKVPFEGESATLTCSSTSTTTPRDPNLRMMYNWKIDNNNISGSRYTYSNTRNKLTISNISRKDANTHLTCTAKEDVSNAYISTSSNSLKLDVYYKPDSGPLIESSNKNFENNTIFHAIGNRQQTLDCSVTGGYPSPSVSWDCFMGSDLDISSGQITAKRRTWIASTNGICKCTSTQMGAASEVVLNVRILSPPSSPEFQLNSRTVPSSSTVKIIRDSTKPITCSSSSYPPSEYKWTYNGQTTEVIQGATLNPSQVTKNGRYYCNAQNTMIPSLGGQESGNSSAFINIERLSPPSKPELRYHNQSGSIITGSFKVVRGDNFILHCSSTGNPPPNYQWTGDGRTISDQVIVVSSIQQDKSYTCKATNTMSPTNLDSVTQISTSTVSVSVLSPATSPTIEYHYSQSGSTPVNSTLKVIKGKSFSVSCLSTGIPTPTLSWSGHKSSNTNILAITSIQSNATYVCTARNYMNRTFGTKATVTSTSDLHIEILYGPSVKPLNVQPVVEGFTLSVECKADPGNPASMTYSWRRKLNSSSMSNWQNIPDSTISGGQLVKQNINRNDTGTYNCTASNVMKPTAESQQTGSSSQKFLLDVLYKTSIMSFIEVSEPSTTNITKHENSSINLTCTVVSNPGSSITILKSNDTVTSVVKSKRISYKKEKISCDTAGIYTCVGYNDYNGETRPSKELRLYVTCSPRLYSEEDFNSQVRGAVGERVKLEIKIKAYPVPKQSDVVWSKNNGNTWNILTDNENIKINHNGLDSSLMFLSVNVSDFQLYSVNISNEYGTLHKEFYLQPYGKPNPPENVNYMEGSLKQTSVIITWKPGFHGGLNQTFHVKYKRQSGSSWQEVTKPDEGTTRMNVTLSGLEPGTAYVYQMYSRNSEGNSDETEILTFKTIEKTDGPGPNTALIVGVVIGSVVVIVAAVVLVVLLRRFSGKKGSSKSSRDNNDRQPVYEDENDYGMRENPMYVSAGPREPSKATEESTSNSAVEYSTVNKIKTVPSDNEYAEVVKTNKSKGKQGKKEKEKSKQGFFKDKKGKRDVQEGDIYENAPANAVSAKDELIYENPEPSKPIKKKNVNKDGLIYADLTFNDQPKGQKKLVIHGLDDMTEYVQVDFTKKAEPLPDSDDENIPAKQ